MTNEHKDKVASKNSLHKRIKNRTDGKRPSTFKELWEKYGKGCGDAYITNIKFVMEQGTMQISWTEKSANETRDRETTTEEIVVTE